MVDITGCVWVKVSQVTGAGQVIPETVTGAVLADQPPLPRGAMTAMSGAGCRFSYWSDCNAASTLGGASGNSRMRRLMAWLTAFAQAASGGTMGASPTPLAP